MSFLEKAKLAATGLAAKADVALANAGLTPGGGAAGTRDGDRLLRDLGVLTYQDAIGRPVPEGSRERVVAALQQLEAAGQLGTLMTSDQAPPPPPPPGAAAAAMTPPPPPGTAATAQSGSVASPPPAVSGPPPPVAEFAPTPVAEQPQTTAVTPPPPPSWATPK
jgi:hypothetical protein